MALSADWLNYTRIFGGSYVDVPGKSFGIRRNGGIPAQQERYVRKLVREAKGFDHVFFEIQNEPWSDRTVLGRVVNPYLRQPARDRYPNSIDLADGLSMAWQAKVAEWIASEEAGLPNRWARKTGRTRSRTGF